MRVPILLFRFQSWRQSGGLYSFSGVIADALGYFHYLIAIVSIAVLFLIPIYLWKAAKTV